MKIDKLVLKNNTRLIAIEDNDAQSACILVLFKVGSRHETLPESGLAHFIEHNFFKGSKNFPTSKDIGMAIEQLGGTSNAFTSYDYTGYYIKVPTDKFAAAARILSDMLTNPTFPEVEVEKERGVVIEEIRMYEDIPMRNVSSKFSEQLFGNKHPLGWDIAGTVDSVSKLNKEDILRFTEKFYNAENCLIAVASSLPSQGVYDIVNELFGPLKSGFDSTFEPFTPSILGRNKYLYDKKVEQTHIVMGGFGHQRNFEKKYPLKVGVSILSRGFGSRLFQVIREELALAYYVNADHTSYEETGYWDVSLGVDNSRIQLAIDAVLKELRTFKKGEFSEAEFERAKNYMIGNMITELETTDDLAYWYGAQELLNNETKTAKEVIEEIKNVTKDEVVEVWDSILKTDNIILTAITPSADKFENVELNLD